MGLNISLLLNIMRESRESQKLSQERVAESLGISKATLSEMESGHIAVGFERWLHWCAILKKSPSDILRQWEKGSEFAKISQERRNGFHTLVDNMIKYGFGLQLESWMGFFGHLVEQEQQERRTKESKRKIRKYFPKADI